MSSDEAVAKVVGKGKTTVIGRMGLTVAGLLIGAVIAFYLVFQFGENERQRELQAWQVRMGIVTESRYADVSDWLKMQKADLRALADNASLQLYMTILHGIDDDEGASAELEYLGNLLTVTAERAGFTAANSGASQVNANVARQGVAGIALLDAKNELVVSSHGFPALVGKLQAFLAELKPGEAGISPVFLNAEGQPTMAFAEPAFVLQGDETADSHIGVVVGVKQVTEELPPLLIQPGAVEKSAEAVLLRQEGLNVEYISPLQDGTSALKKKLNMDTPDLAAAFVMRDASGFGVMKDYKGDEVLVLGRAFEEVPWVLMYKIDRQEALADSEARVNMLVIVLGMVIVVVLIGMLALWYFGTSKRAKEAADKFEKLADRFAGQRNFMHLVTDSQPNTIAIFDADGNYRWFNQRVIEQSGLERADLFDKNVSAVLGPIEGKKMIGWVHECLDNEAPHTKTHKMNLDGKTERVYKSDFIMIPSNEQYAAAVLVVSQDITDSVREREKRETVMRQLVSTLVSLVDRRDPFSSDHSQRVADVSRAIAYEMELDSLEADTAAIAGSLMNLGKIAVPAEILTKQGALTDEERKIVQDSVLSSADLVANIDFDGPVRDTMRQMLENVDGTGIPNGLLAEDILMPARVASVANAFVGMVSARAWRQGMDFDKAAGILYSETGSKYDRAAVAALINILNNRGGRDTWKSYGIAPEEDVKHVD